MPNNNIRYIIFNSITLAKVCIVLLYYKNWSTDSDWLISSRDKRESLDNRSAWDPELF